MREVLDDDSDSKGEELGPGLLRSIERDLEPCLGKKWLKE